MRLRSLILASVVSVGAVVLSPVVTAAGADTGPHVVQFAVPSAGPGSLTSVVAQGLAPNETTQLTLVDTADPTSTFAMAPLNSTSVGAIVSPTGYRSPTDVVPGTYQLLLQQASGASVTSPSAVIIAAPTLVPINDLSPGGGMVLVMTGLSGAASISRSATVDGVSVPLSAVQETFTRYGDHADGFDRITATLPATLQPGSHTLALTQAAVPAVTVTRPFTLSPPALFVTGTYGSNAKYGVGSKDTVSLTGERFGPAGASVSVRAADGRTYALPDLDARGDASTTLPGLAVGDAVFTAVGKGNGVSADYTVSVLPSTLTSTARLGAGGTVVSPSGQVVLAVGYDANLVLQKDGQTLWTSRSGGHTGYDPRLTVQSDGNLVVYGADNRVFWNSRTTTRAAPTTLTVLDDGRAVLTSARGAVLWATPTTSTSSLPAGTVLKTGGRLQNERFALVVQSDGNVVLYGGPTALFDTHTAGHPGSVLHLQSDGNLVLYSSAGTALWANRVSCGADARLLLQSDGNLVEYAANGKAVWSTHTAGH